jgi:hypothetical protein
MPYKIVFFLLSFVLQISANAEVTEEQMRNSDLDTRVEIKVEGIWAREVFFAFKKAKIPAQSKNRYFFETLYSLHYHQAWGADARCEKKELSGYEVRIYNQNKVSYVIGDLNSCRNQAGKELYEALLKSGGFSAESYYITGKDSRFDQLEVFYDQQKATFKLKAIVTFGDQVFEFKDFLKTHPTWATENEMEGPFLNY